MCALCVWVLLLMMWMKTVKSQRTGSNVLTLLVGFGAILTVLIDMLMTMFVLFALMFSTNNNFLRFTIKIGNYNSSINAGSTKLSYIQCPVEDNIIELNSRWTGLVVVDTILINLFVWSRWRLYTISMGRST